MNKESLTTNKKTDKKTAYITRLALITAIMLIMSFTPLGYLRTPFLSVTLMSVPVAIGGILFGPLCGTWCGIVFGVTSVINAVTGGGITSMLLIINPLGAVFTMLFPRIIDGYLTALIYKVFKDHKAKRLGIFFASLACPVLNTVLFMSALILIFFNSEYIQGLASSLGTSDPFILIAALIGVQGIIEAVLCCLITFFVTPALFRLKKSE